MHEKHEIKLSCNLLTTQWYQPSLESALIKYKKCRVSSIEVSTWVCTVLYVHLPPFIEINKKKNPGRGLYAMAGPRKAVRPT